MQHLLFEFRHDEFGLLSDRSSREILKQLGKSIRAAQLAELDDFIFGLALEYADQRSLQEQLREVGARLPTFYLQKLEKGSLLLLGAASASFVLFLAKRISERFADDDAVREDALAQLDEYVNADWARDLARRIYGEVEGRGLGARTELDGFEIVDTDNGVLLKAKLTTDPEEGPAEEPPTPATVQNFLNEQLGGRRSEER